MREVAADPRMTTTAADRKLASFPVNMAITWTQRAVSELLKRILNPIGEFARPNEGEIARRGSLMDLNRSAHTFCVK